MDKILSAEEWKVKNFPRTENIWNTVMVKLYSTYLLEAFAGEVKSKAKIKEVVDYYGNKIDDVIDPESIDQLLNKFKEKL